MDSFPARPLDPASGRPLMSALEAGIHVNAAGLRAEEEARRSGGEPAAKSALGRAAAREVAPVTIAGVPLKPLTAGTLWALELLGSHYVAPSRPDGAPHALSSEEVLLAAVCFMSPEETFLALDSAQDDPEAMEAAVDSLRLQARRLAFRVTIPDLRALHDFIDREVLSADSAGEAPPASPAAGGLAAGPPPASGPAPGKPIPPDSPGPGVRG